MSNSKQNRFKGLMQVIRQESATSVAEDNGPEFSDIQKNGSSKVTQLQGQPEVIWVHHSKGSGLDLWKWRKLKESSA